MQLIEPTWSKQNEYYDLRLWHADCFDILPNIPDHSVDLIFADLPYGVTACHWDSVLPLDKLWEHYRRIVKKNGVVILSGTQPFTWKLCASNPDWFRYEIIWEKANGTNPLLAKKQPLRVHENVLVFYPKQPTYNPQMSYGHVQYSGFSDDTKYVGEVYGGEKNRLISMHQDNDGSRYPRSIQRFPHDSEGTKGHPTKKPTALMLWLVKTYTNENDMVLDNTMGGGTTGVACAKSKRKFIGIELEKKYFDMAVENIVAASRNILQITDSKPVVKAIPEAISQVGNVMG